MMHIPLFGPLLSANPIFAKLQTLKINDVYKYQVSKFVFKCINKISPNNFQNWFSINHERHGHHTRLNYNITDGNKINNLFIPSARTTNYGLKQLKVSGPRIWNALPLSLKKLTSINIFSCKLNSTLYQNMMDQSSCIFMFSPLKSLFFLK